MLLSRGDAGVRHGARCRQPKTKERQVEVSLQSVTYLVLDEADALLQVFHTHHPPTTNLLTTQMGFETQVRDIVAQTSPLRQTLLFSGTPPLLQRSVTLLR